MLQGWVDLVWALLMFLPRLLGKSTIVLLSATATYVMLTRGYHG